MEIFVNETIFNCERCINVKNSLYQMYKEHCKVFFKQKSYELISSGFSISFGSSIQFDFN